jgi:hypothetical protein
VATPTPTTSVSAVVSVFFARAVTNPATDGAIRVAATTRTIASSGSRRAVLEAALAAVEAGPTRAERRIGFRTAIAADAEVLGVGYRSREAVIDVSASFAASAVRRDNLVAIAQIVFTATAIDGVDAVTFSVDGSAVETFTPHDLTATDLTRDDLVPVRPAVLVTSPGPFATAGGWIRLAGEANTADGRVRYELLDAGGAVLVSGTTRAGAAGSWSAFGASVRVTVVTAQTGTLVLWSGTDSDGDRADVVAIPLELTP